MANEHWFDTLHRKLTENFSRRGLIPAAGVLVMSLTQGGAPWPGLAKSTRRKGKRKRKGKGKGKPKANSPARCGVGMCAREWPFDAVNRDACELKCGRCRIREKFCIVEANSSNPVDRATCCFAQQTCCDDPTAATGLVCADTATDVEHCGQCQNPCPLGMVCDGGQCACPGNEARCNNACVDLASDRAHCGSCNNPCDADEECVAGICIPRQFLCDPSLGLTYCQPQGCVDTRTSIGHCGRCNNPCTTGGLRHCVQGQCGCNPAANTVRCNTACIPSGYKCCEDFGGYGCSNPNATCTDVGGCGAP